MGTFLPHLRVVFWFPWKMAKHKKLELLTQVRISQDSGGILNSGKTINKKGKKVAARLEWFALVHVKKTAYNVDSVTTQSESFVSPIKLIIKQLN